MKFKELMEEDDKLQVFVAYEGTGNPNDQHTIIGVEIKYKNPPRTYGNNFVPTAIAVGEVAHLPIKEREG